MIIAAGIVGAAVVAANVLLLWRRLVPRGRLGPLGYGRDIWIAVVAVYAAGVAIAVLPFVLAAIVVVLAVGFAAFLFFPGWVWRVGLPVGAAALLLGAGALSGASRWLTVVVFFAASFGVLVWQKVPASITAGASRLPRLLRHPATGWLVTALVAASVGAAAAIPAEEAGVLIMGAAVVAGAIVFWRGEFGPRLALIACLAGAAVPSLLVLLDDGRSSGEWTAFILGLAATVFGLGLAVLVLYMEIFGPFQPESRFARSPYPDAFRWIWIGGVTETTASVVVRPRLGEAATHIELTVTPPPADRPTAHPIDGVVARFDLEGLEPGRRYALAVSGDGHEATASFRTPGSGDETLRIAVGSCCSTGSNGVVFDRIAALEPAVFCQIGDLHYENVDLEAVPPYREAIDATLSTPALTNLMSRVPVAYVFDDHDFGKNNSNRSSKSGPWVRQNHRQLVPTHPTDVGADDTVYQQFKVGPAFVVMTDLRSERDPEPERHWRGPAGTRQMMGEAQERALLDAPARAAGLGCQIVLWCSTAPFVGEDGADLENWSGFPEQRRRIAERLSAAAAEHRVTVIVASGDSHMVGLDEGTADRSHLAPDAAATTEWKGRVFPALNAAALDRRGSAKGVHYGNFSQEGAGQFGIIRIEQTAGRAAGLALEVHDHERMLHEIAVPIG